MIQNNLDTSSIKIERCNCRCAFTGQKIQEGVRLSELIKDTFTDYSNLKYKSDFASLEIASSMMNIIQGKKGFISLRNFSFIVNQEKLILLKNSDLLDYLINTIDPPFKFCISFSNKKHLYFKSKTNVNKSNYTVTTDIGDCKISVGKVKFILPILKKWYTVVQGKEETTQQETYFTKKEILFGCQNYKKIEQYGYSFFEENESLKQYRNTLFLKILVHCLNKNHEKN